ncbi:acyltransferase family protein [Mesorhizobium sophorae]|uniref:acyltransferase family protein n=1 Tax=Mesorhizobium sophorae TaxID=1300294 RepID=UPI00142E8F4D|nr:acyltransferase family protein [Mesorhizobium sophorae]
MPGNSGIAPPPDAMTGHIALGIGDYQHPEGAMDCLEYGLRVETISMDQMVEAKSTTDIGSRSDHRSDIDVLRAIAVAAVVLFHLGWTTVSGGFVGVDVFFVISGYLISRIIWTESAQGRFSLKNFYARRARRLLPALFATIVVTFVVAAFLFIPEQFQDLSRSAIFSLLGLANVDFWMQSGYFDSGAILKPLLHIWTLAVELQFYAFWPFLIAMAVRKSYWVAFSLIAAAFAASLAGCLWMMGYDPTAAFFLVPFRVWEFAAGGLVFLTERRLSKVYADLLYVVGLAAILFAIFGYSGRTAYPGVAALAPVLGAALMLLGGQGRLARQAQFRPAIYLGKISYSVYLVHWPLVVFMVYRFGALEVWQILASLVSTLALGAASYHFIEVRYRKPCPLKLGKTLIFACLTAGLMAAATQSWATDGWVWRMPAAFRNAYVLDLRKEHTYTFSNSTPLLTPHDFKTTKRHLLIIGDSQGADIINLLVETGAAKQFEIIYRQLDWRCGVPTLPVDLSDRYWKSINPFAAAVMKPCNEAYSLIRSTPASLEHADLVMIALYWQDFAFPYVQTSVDEMRSQTSAPIYVVGSKNFTGSSLQLLNKHGTFAGIDEYAFREISPVARKIDTFLKTLSHVSYIDPLVAVCPHNQCEIFTDKSAPVFWDSMHWTKAGVQLIAAKNGVAIFPFLDTKQAAGKNSP